MKSFRTDKMASLVRTIASDMIANKVHDPRIGKFVSITRVEVTQDMQMAKIFVSVMGTEEDQRSTMRGLKSAQGLIQRAVAKGVTARICPHLTFISDHSIKKAAEIMEIINHNAAEMGPPPDDSQDDDQQDDDQLADDQLDGDLPEAVADVDDDAKSIEANPSNGVQP
ncbi:MAG TPA: 30S ribosome-binding factor RbfA [Phycisphaerae bacterium]|nr:30S ribosome-binding factor RbfA [Phycisphaerae bacterium]